MIKNDSRQLLEFDKILTFIASFANSTPSQQAIAEILPLGTREAIEKRFGQVEEIRRLAQIGVPLRLSPFEDIAPLLEEVRPEGAVLDPHDLVVLTPLLQTLAAIAKQFGYRTDIPLLHELAGHLTGFPHILDRLEVTLDFEGNILDTASRLLQDLRARKRGLTARIRKRLEEIVREPRVAIFLQDEFVTQRGGRWVIPVRMDSKGMVAGVVHDVSNTGETAFMEPLEIIGLANELENLAAEIKAEEIRIIRDICREIRIAADEIGSEFATLVQLDMLNSIARFAELIQAHPPSVSETPLIMLRQARHPLLMLMHRQGGGHEPVPLDLHLGDIPDTATVMIITGPNAGGKTIAIKTVGLLIVLALAGIPIPADPSSTIPLADELLVDMGDDQSIESSLSTFSAHVANMAEILRQAGRRSIVLMDELGTGTEPGQGAAIACGVLKELQEKGALVLATTHLTDIVAFVHRNEGMINASMEFDQRTFTPLYRLQAGEPGQSHAIEIARRYGMPAGVIEFAQHMLGSRETEFHSLLAELKEKRLRYGELLADTETREKGVEERERLLAVRLAQAEEAKQDAMGKAFLQAREIVAAIKRETRAILDEAKREKSRDALKKLETIESGVEEQLREYQGGKPLSLEELRPGDLVFVRSIGFDATIVKIDGKQQRLRVKAGQREVEVPLADIAAKKGKQLTEIKSSRRKTADEAEASHELKLLGLRVDAALSLIEPFLNHASLAGLGKVRIIHGTGTGALMKAVREYLDGHPLVREFRSGEQFEGGNGVTIVTMR
ncbi:endonuclease MutS2 [Geotalea uraniireducens]|uniref:Endonuclease MutS2 n=1 Tax=Geotalea uraniireducens (strain Rf4) TaxID=351605 RepID=A5GBA5_GEOUR|nr:endonuclease MutS2 [Geotalea uraniireducens]ABQ25141.1 MutS2 family protein [Geotalea uraniireducens Rf4]